MTKGKKTDRGFDADEMSALLRAGQVDRLVAAVAAALEEGADAREILDEALVPGMASVGEDFRRNRVYVPEVLISARAMKEAMVLLEPALAASGAASRGTLVIGTVAGDLHDIGKNLVAILTRGAGIRVVDLGVNVPADRFIEAAEEHEADIVGLSCLLTTTMGAMAETTAALKEDGPEGIRVAVGGAPTTKRFAEEIGADGYGRDAVEAVKVFEGLIGN